LVQQHLLLLDIPGGFFPGPPAVSHRLGLPIDEIAGLAVDIEFPENFFDGAF